MHHTLKETLAELLFGLLTISRSLFGVLLASMCLLVLKHVLLN
jgi:hypothetical protein